MVKFIKSNRLFVKLVGVNLLSKVGDRFFYTAMLMAATVLPQKEIAVMLVSISETLPILLSVFMGVLADKKSQKVRGLVCSSLIRVFFYGVIGCLFSYRLTLSLVMFAAVLNLLSDMAGNYSTALFSPFTKVMIEKSDMEKAQSLVSFSSQSVSVLATFLGSICLIFVSQSRLAFINAIFFLLAAFLFTRLAPNLQKVENKMVVDSSFSTGKVVRENMRWLVSDKKIIMNLLQLTLLNGFFGGLTPIFTLFVQKDSGFGMLSAPIKISLLSGIITLAMIAGNLCASRLFRSYSITFLNRISDVFAGLVGLGFLLNHTFVIFLMSAFLAFNLGIVSPRFSAKIINTYSVKRLGGIITSVNACLVLAPPITAIIFPLLFGFSMVFAYWGFVGYGLLLFLFSFLFSVKRLEEK